MPAVPTTPPARPRRTTDGGALTKTVDAATFRARVESAVADELDELGSPQLLDALTGGDPTRRSLLEVAANSEYAARETFERWTRDADDRTRDALEALVEQETRHYDLVTDLLETHEPPAGISPLHAYLRTREDPVERVGAGLVGRPLYTLRAHERIASFFGARDAPSTVRDGPPMDRDGPPGDPPGDRDERAVAVVEELRSDTAATLDRGTALLETLCGDADDRERARATATYAVTVAHDDYRDGLAALER